MGEWVSGWVGGWGPGMGGWVGGNMGGWGLLWGWSWAGGVEALCVGAGGWEFVSNSLDICRTFFEYWACFGKVVGMIRPLCTGLNPLYVDPVPFTQNLIWALQVLMER